uniref:Uncharacterized protein n=1 Tax=Strigamia maritima TaxID=126957 RepID=T1IWX9_STRMM
MEDDGDGTMLNQNSHLQTPTDLATASKKTIDDQADNMSGKTSGNVEFMFKSLVAGGVAGMCAKTTVAPLDRMKILIQAHNEHYKDLRGGIITGLRQIISKESFIALYKGNFAQMVRIFPYAAVQFTSFEIYKQHLFGNLLGAKSHISKFLAGSLAGVTAVSLTYPLDVVRARLAFQVTGQHVYRGISHTLTSIVQQEGGIRGLYRGYLPTVMGMVPYAGLSFYSFECLKYLTLTYAPKWTTTPHSQSTGGVVLTIPAKLFCGGMAGAIAQSVAYPLDVTRRRMQLGSMNPQAQKFSKSWFSTLMIILNDHGIVKGLYRGMSINYVRAIPMVSVSFTTYELMKQFLDLDTGTTL